MGDVKWTLLLPLKKKKKSKTPSPMAEIPCSFKQNISHSGEDRKGIFPPAYLQEAALHFLKTT